MLNSHSGLLALAGDNDMREVHRRIAAGDRDARNSRSTSTATGSASTSAPTWRRWAAPTRSPSPPAWARTTRVVRARSLAGLERLGIEVDAARNAAGGPVISPDGAPVTVLVVPTDEELEMAVQAAALVR